MTVTVLDCTVTDGSSALRSANDGAIVELDLVAAHVDQDLAVIAGFPLGALRRDHDPHPRRLPLVHRNQQQIAVSEAEQLA